MKNEPGLAHTPATANPSGLFTAHRLRPAMTLGLRSAWIAMLPTVSSSFGAVTLGEPTLKNVPPVPGHGDVVTVPAMVAVPVVVFTAVITAPTLMPMPEMFIPTSSVPKPAAADLIVVAVHVVAASVTP